MKKLFCILFSLVLALGLAACKEEKQEPQRYELAQKTIREDGDFKVMDEDGTVWLEKEHIEKVFVCYEESKGRYLELKLTKDGIGVFKKANRKKNGNLSVVLNDKLLATPLEKYEDSAIVLGEYEYIMNCFNEIT